MVAPGSEILWPDLFSIYAYFYFENSYCIYFFVLKQSDILLLYSYQITS